MDTIAREKCVGMAQRKNRACLHLPMQTGVGKDGPTEPISLGGRATGAGPRR
jgi:hypothetical protein